MLADSLTMGKNGIPPSGMSNKRRSRLQNFRRYPISFGGQDSINHPSAGDVDPRKSLQSVIASSEVSHGNIMNETFGESSGAASTIQVKNDYCLEGRRIVDIVMWFKQMATLENHSHMGCRISDFVVVSERLDGLRSGFTVKCKTCHCQSVVWTDDPEQAGGRKDINLAATSGIIAIEGGHSQLEELCERLKVPCMTNKAFIKHKNRLVHMPSGSGADGKNGVASKERPLGQGCGIPLANGVSVIPVTASGSRVHAKNESSSAVDSDLLSVAEPVQVFVDVPTAPVISSDVALEEVDPFMDVDKPVDDAWEKGVDKRPLGLEVRSGPFVHRDSLGKGCTTDVPETPGCDDHRGEFVAYSLESDVVILNEDGDEKPTLGLKSFCCSLEKCHKMFDSLDDLNRHQRLCHSSVRGAHQLGSVGLWCPSEESELKKVPPSGSKIGEVRSGSLLMDTLLKPSKKMMSGIGNVDNKSSTTPSEGEIHIKQALDDNLSEGEKTVVLSGDSSRGPKAPGVMMKVETAEEEEDDIVCVETKFFCKQCSVTFTDESSLKKHMTEKHREGGGLSVQASGNVAHAGGLQGKISLARDLFVSGSSFPSPWNSNADMTPRADSNGLRVVITDSPGDCVTSQIEPKCSNSSVSGQTLASRNLTDQAKTSERVKLCLTCDVCNKPFEGGQYIHLALNSRVAGRVCKGCEEKVKASYHIKNSGRFQCRICGQKYSMKSTLKRHERVHTGERPYVCGICGRTYTRNEYLRDHMKNHDPNEATS